MKLSAFLVITSLWLIHVRLSNADYRYRRGPPQPPRAPPMPPYMKKWHHRQPPPARPRPIPVHMNGPPPQFKKPIGPPVPKRSVPLGPVNPRPPIPQLPQQPPPPPPNWSTHTKVLLRPTEKPFVSSPKVQLSEYEYHVQTNQIPNHSNLIKQMDEKGPIHTIPAPNLSLADKPAHIDIPPAKQQTIVEIQKAHTYQVTELPEHNSKKHFELLHTTPQDPTLQLNHYFQQQYPVIDQYAYPSLLPQIFQPEPAYIQQFHKEHNPEFHSFNYEEPAPKSSQVSAEYAIQPEQPVNINNVDVNYEEELINGDFYASLPNKEAAEALASLQEAGKQTNAASQRDDGHMTIYVPDDSDKQQQQQQQKDVDYDEGYSHEEQGEPQVELFGSRITPKNY